MTIEIVDPDTAAFNEGTIIKVIGVGGAGGNAVNHMIRNQVQGVEFICANTDAQALRRSQADSIVQLGKTGLGAGANPNVGKEAALEIRERLQSELQGAHMVFITAGMGGGTGTGAAPVVAALAREMGILTVGVVTRPFEFEGVRRSRAAEAGLAELQSNVDSLIVVHNEKLYDVMGEDASMDECFQAVDDVLKNAVAGISEIINVEGNVNVDFEDLRTVMKAKGKAMMGMAVASGPDRARVAAMGAIASPLLEGVSLSGAQGVLINITASRTLKLRESRQIVDLIRAQAAEDATIIFGTAHDDSMGETVRVTVVATGLGNPEREAQPAAHQQAAVAPAAPVAPVNQVPVNATSFFHRQAPATLPVLQERVSPTERVEPTFVAPLPAPAAPAAPMPYLSAPRLHMPAAPAQPVPAPVASAPVAAAPVQAPASPLSGVRSLWRSARNQQPVENPPFAAATRPAPTQARQPVYPSSRTQPAAQAPVATPAPVQVAQAPAAAPVQLVQPMVDNGHAVPAYMKHVDFEIPAFLRKQAVVS